MNNLDARHRAVALTEPPYSQMVGKPEVFGFASD